MQWLNFFLYLMLLFLLLPTVNNATSSATVPVRRKRHGHTSHNQTTANDSNKVVNVHRLPDVLSSYNCSLYVNLRIQCAAETMLLSHQEVLCQILKFLSWQLHLVIRIWKKTITRR